MPAFRLTITGRVQGVGYRAWFHERALDAGLNGWVRNRLDGSVDALISGDAALCLALIQDAHDGPLAARVSDVHVAPAEGIVADGFSIKPTV